MQVVGVARDIKHRSLLEPPQPIVYVPLSSAFLHRRRVVRSSVREELAGR